MTATATERFWAPQRPTTEPDAVVLALLDPDAGDLATKLLAVHRAGAAACEVVAKQAVPGERALILALADVREKVAPAAVDGVSKALGKEPTYAGLLVRDLLDDAEQGALDLFRAAVAKGVAPPVAVQRAGAVYGLPRRALGAYGPLAVDPKSSPTALTDAADRALLGWAAALQAEEAGEPVVKADEGAAQQWQEKEHPRNKIGRFVDAHGGQTQAAPALSPLDRIRARLGFGAHAPAVAERTETTSLDRQIIAEALRNAEQETQEASVQRKESRQRARQGARSSARSSARQQARATSRSTARVTQTAEPAAEVAQQRGTRTVTRRGERKRSRRMERARRRRSTGPGTYTPPPMLPPGNDSWMTRLPSTGADSYSRVYASLGTALSAEQWEALQRGKQESAPDTYRFRAGWLARTGVDFDEVEDPDDLSANPMVHDKIGFLANAERDHLGVPYRDPAVISVGNDEDRDLLERRIGEIQSDLSRRDNPEHIYVVDDYRDPNRTVVVHFTPPPGTVPGSLDYDDRPIPEVNVLVLEHNGFEGYVEGNRHPQWRLDPNQVLRFSRHGSYQMWDSKRGVMVTVWPVVPVDESDVEDDVGKADPPRVQLATSRGTAQETINQLLQRAREEWSEAEHPRNRIGQFVDAHTAVPASETRQETRRTVARQAARRGRTSARTNARTSVRAGSRTEAHEQREEREEREAPARATERATARATERATERATARATARRTADPTATGTLHGVLSDRDGVQVYTLRRFQQIFQAHPGTSDVIDVSSRATDAMMTENPWHPETALDVVGRNLRRDLTNKDGPQIGPSGQPAWRHMRTVSQADLPTDEDVADYTAELLRKDPDTHLIHVVYDRGDITFLGNFSSPEPQVLVEIPPEVDIDRPTRLVPQGRYETTNLLVSYADHQGLWEVGRSADMAFSAPVIRYRVEQAEWPRHRG